MAAPRFSPGFRLSTLDSVVLIVGIAGAAALAAVEEEFVLAVGIPLIHFFLFCNVFRVARPLELLWSSIFVVLAGPTIVWGIPGWWPTSLASICVATVGIAVEMRMPSYHGVGWQRINPELPAWWKAHGPHLERDEPMHPRDSPWQRAD